MEQLQKQVLQTANNLQQQAIVAGQDLYKTIQADFDLSPLQKIIKTGASVDEVHALITNKTVLKYAFWLVVANATAVIAGRQAVRGRSPLYTILAALACVFLAPTIVPLLTGTPITWIQNDNNVLTGITVAVATYLVLRHFLLLFPFRLIAAVVLAAANAGVLAAGYKLGLTTFKSVSGALVVGALDATVRPFSLALEAYLVDGSVGSTKHLRSNLFAAVVYTVILQNQPTNEKLALVAAFAIIAIGYIASILGNPINWFFPVELMLLGTSSPRVPKATVKAEAVKTDTVAVKPEPGNTASPSKKGNKH